MVAADLVKLGFGLGLLGFVGVPRLGSVALLLAIELQPLLLLDDLLEMPSLRFGLEAIDLIH